jgi:RIO kinase 1
LREHGARPYDAREHDAREHDAREHDAREDDAVSQPIRRRRRRFDDDPAPAPARHRRPATDVAALDGRGGSDIDGPPSGDRWSTWDGAEHGPEPRPLWVITEHAAVDTELGVIKTGKEAEVHLVERAVPGTGRRTLLAAKRYRTVEHRLFHRDAGYLEGRRTRRSRETRAMTRRTAFGRDLLSGQWALAEFRALAGLWSDGVAVPYPVQLSGTELVLEFLGDADGRAAPRLAQLRPEPEQLRELWRQLVAALLGLARRGLTHGDLSAYNLLVHDGRLVLIDLPQVVDVVGNPQGPQFLARDVHRIADWFAARGLPAEPSGTDGLFDELRGALHM